MFVQGFNNNILIFNNNYMPPINNFSGSNDYGNFFQQDPKTEVVPSPLSTALLPYTQNLPPDGAHFEHSAASYENNAAISCTIENVPPSLGYDTITDYAALTYRSTKFRVDQAEFLCRTLESSENIQKLADFLAELPADDLAKTSADSNGESTVNVEDWRKSQQIARAKALVLFHERRFDDFYAFVASRQFASEHHALLQRLWNEAHYAETEMIRGKQLDPVSRYRVRKKNPYPSTIWDGEGTSYCFKKSARVILRNAYRRQRTPSQPEKRQLAAQTNLSITQVSNWFKNQRQRARQYAREGRAPPSSSAAYDDDDEDGEDCTTDEDDQPDENSQRQPRSTILNDPSYCESAAIKRGRLAATADTTYAATMTQMCDVNNYGAAAGAPLYGNLAYGQLFAAASLAPSSGSSLTFNQA